MTKTLAVRGDATHGADIIRSLELLGGINGQSLLGNNVSCIYYINGETKHIESDLDSEEKSVLFSIYDYAGLKKIVDTHVPIGKIDMAEGNYDNKVELILGEQFEATIENNKVVITKKLYLYTFQECCEIMGVHVSGELLYDSDEDLTQYENSLIDGLDALRKLIICRDAYWKISGEKPEECSLLYCICWDPFIDKMISKTSSDSLNRLLAFPKEDMRDTFAKKFDYLIVKCKNFI